MVKFIYVTDVHGMIDVYERAFERAESKDVDFLVFGGDITSGATPKCQKFFLEFYLIKRLKEFRKKTRKPVFMMMGNDDFSSNFPLLRKAGRDKLVKVLHGGFYEFADFVIAGYPFVNPTPFLLKDWEKREDEIAKDLAGLSKKIKQRKAIYVFHAPPYGTKLDVMHNGVHKGSEAIRKFIEHSQPMLSLHGHIHESSKVSGAMKQRIGKTLCVNPGNAEIVEVNLSNMKIRRIRG